MSQYGSIGLLSAANTVFVESADPEDLQARVIAELAAIDDSLAITAITLAGGGDGHTFVVAIESGPLTDAFGGLPGTSLPVIGTVVRCYLAGTAEELSRAQAEAGVPDPVVAGQLTIPYALADVQLAGSSKGTRFMGMSVFTSTGAPSGIFEPVALAALTTAQALNVGAQLVSFASLPFANQFSLPTPDRVLYTGTQSFVGKIDATIAVSENAANDVTVQIVTDPTGTPSPIGTMITHVAAGEYDTVAVFGIAIFAPSSLSPSSVGLLVTAGGAGSVRSAQLRITR